MQIQSRQTYLLTFAVIAGLLLFSLYLQFYQGVIPCPLCSLQRMAFMFIAILALMTAFLFRFRHIRLILNFITFTLADIGILLAGRQIWLQHFPPAGNSECSPSLQYMIQVLPMHEVIQKVFSGSAECSDTSWSFLHINMAEWAILWFVFLSGLFLYLFITDLCQRKMR